MADEAFRVDVFGGLRPSVDGVPCAAPGPRGAALLALLVLARHEPVSTGELLTWLWGEDAPPSAANQVQRLVGQLRRLFQPALEARSDGAVVLRAGEGYRLADGVRSDLFDLDAGAVADPVALVTRRPFAGLEQPLADHPWRVALERQRVAVAVAALDGADAAAVDRVELLAVHFPFEETLQARLVEALGRVGRRQDALALHDRVTTGLADELGVEPGPELRAARDAVLVEGEPRVARRTPAQLPAVIPGLVVRPDAQAALDRIASAGEAGAVVVTAIGGMGGIGKTTLAVAWAHDLAPRFPDGQLYVNLRGFDAEGKVKTTVAALTELLDALGVRAEPTASADTLAAQARSVMAGRRYLLLLDNARDADQVRPLLPGHPSCLAIVTSRNRLSSLVAREGAVPVSLDRMPDAEATSLLVRRLGPAIVGAHPDATQAVLRACGGLPLALSVVATRIAVDPALTLADLAAELRPGHAGGWSDGAAPDGPWAVFRWSYDALEEDAARAFRLLALHPGSRLSRASVASLLGLPRERSDRLLDVLAEVSLVQRADLDHVVVHDLLRAFALAKLEDPDERDAATARLVDHFVQSARNAMLSFRRAHPRPARPALPGVTPTTIESDLAAGRWYTDERETIRAVVNVCFEQRQLRDAADILMDCRPMSQRDDRHTDRADLDRRLIELVGDQGVDLLGQTLFVDVVRDLGYERGLLGDHAGALADFERAVALMRGSGDLITEAALAMNIGTQHSLARNHAEAFAALDRALALAEKSGSEQLLCTVHGQQAEVRRRSGDLEGALASLDVMFRLLEEFDLGVFPRFMARFNRADVLALLGRYTEATAEVTLLQREVEVDQVYMTGVLMLEAVVAYHAGEVDRAARALAEFHRLTEPEHAELYRLGRPDEVDLRLTMLAEVEASLRSSAPGHRPT